MTTSFSDQAIKRSLGILSLAGVGPLSGMVTPTVTRSKGPEGPISVSSSEFRTLARDHEPLELQLYEARAQAKILISKVAMHLSADWRLGLHRQLDSLLDVEEWMDGEAPLGTNSFSTFMRLMLLIQPQVRPGIGLTSRGNLIASWQAGSARLSVECLPNDHIRFVLSHQVDDNPESAAGDSTVARFMNVLAPYNPAQWLSRVPT